jgi:hypothetical protein
MSIGFRIVFCRSVTNDDYSAALNLKLLFQFDGEVKNCEKIGAFINSV